MTYNSEYWVIKAQHVFKINVVKIKMLRWMPRHIEMDRVQNECTREKVGVVPI
ncbi:conserved hypothetical protein [Ricinus communis]|uniref:Uncharacterized protein n=1 Tax=Ricinus communis TaxID=3988 RepID=B9SM46_RICCO|nr:conserved hypothetical protein [Ricinus communis]